MNGLDWFSYLVEFSKLMAGLAMNGFFQSLAVGALGLAAAGVIRRRGAAARNAIYRMALLSMFVAPVASFGLARCGFLGWSLPVPSAYVVGRMVADSEPGGRNDTESPGRSGITLDREDSANNAILERSPDVSFPANPELGTTRSTRGTFTATGRANAGTATADDSKPHENEAESRRLSRFGLFYLLVPPLWIIVSGMLLVRLTAAYLRMGRIQREANPADTTVQALCRQLASGMGLRQLDVRHSPFITSPCLCGIWHVAILLPEPSISNPSRDVLIHELAHFGRRDCFWNLFRQCVTAAFWFQPLAWVLSQRCASSAEEICDDYVLHHGGDRRDYAERLVDIAELALPSPGAAVVGIVSLRSLLSTRVIRILDSSRELSLRAGARFATCVVLGGLMSTLIAGVVGLRGASPMSMVDAIVNAEEAAPPAVPVAASDPRADELKPVRVVGSVVDSNGNPVPNAGVAAWQHRTPNLPQVRVDSREIAHTQTDAEGKFALDTPVSWPDPRVPQSTSQDLEDEWRSAATFVAVNAKGFAPSWISARNHEQLESLRVELTKASADIDGQFLDSDGQPMAGLQVRVVAIGEGIAANMERWFEAVEEQDRTKAADSTAEIGMLVLDEQARTFANDNSIFPLNGANWLPNHAQELIPDQQSDAAGHVRIRGLSPNQLVMLEVNGPNVPPQRLIVTTRKSEKLRLASLPVYESAISDGFLGNEFRHIMPPGEAITGRIIDAETEEPIGGVRIMLMQRWGDSPHSRYVNRGVTDESGHFEILGHPRSKGDYLTINPSDKSFYFSTEFAALTSSSGQAPDRLEFRLRKGILVKGIVRETNSGKPVRAQIGYCPLADNPIVKDYAVNFGMFGVVNPSLRFRSTEDGRFEVLVIPGKGLVFAYARDPVQYAKGYGAEKVEGTDEEGRFPVRGLISKQMVQGVVPIEVETGKPTADIELFVLAGGSRRLAPRDSLGNRLLGSRTIYSHVRNNKPDSKLDATAEFVEVKSLSPGETRQVIVWHPETQQGAVVDVSAAPENVADDQEPLPVVLYPHASVTARVVDEFGKPVVGYPFQLSLLPVRDLSPTPEQALTDSDGHVTFQTLAAGGEYSIGGYGNAKFGYVELWKNFTVQPGETIDLGTIDITKPERPEPLRKQPPKANDAKNAQGGRLRFVAEEAKVAATLWKYSGNVVTPDGRPAAGAKIYLVFPVGQSTPSTPFARNYAANDSPEKSSNGWPELAITDAGGNFAFEASADHFGPEASEYEFENAMIVAAMEPFGFAHGLGYDFETTGALWSKYQGFFAEVPQSVREFFNGFAHARGQPLRLLPDEIPLHGRIVDLNGQPVPKVDVSLTMVYFAKNESLVEWNEQVRRPNADSQVIWRSLMGSPIGPQTAAFVPSVRTDDQGYFLLRGVGQSRIAQLRVEGPGIESTEFLVRTAPGEIIRLKSPSVPYVMEDTIIFPAECTFAVGPSIPLTGVVRDARTHEPISHAAVGYEIDVGFPRNATWRSAATDSRGRFSLNGIPLAKSTSVQIICGGDVPYPPLQTSIELRGDEPTHEMTFDMPTGVWAEGSVTDAKTGKGIQGRFEYQPDPANNHLPKSFQLAEHQGLTPDSNTGRFRFPILRGKGYLAFRVFDRMTPRAISLTHPDGTFVEPRTDVVQTALTVFIVSDYGLVTMVEVAADSDRFSFHPKLGSGLTRVVRVVDEAGGEAREFEWVGRDLSAGWTYSSRGTIELLNYDPTKPRDVFVRDAERNLVGHAEVAGDSQEELVIPLGPGGMVRGRLVDADGQPLADMFVVQWHAPIQTPGDLVRKTIGAPLPPNRNTPHESHFRTDRDGRFEIKALQPGLTYYLRAFQPNRRVDPNDAERPRSVGGPLDCVIEVRAGETLDLGDVRLADELEFKRRLSDQ